MNIRDVELQHKVLAQLNWDPAIESGHIGVTARDGVVTLSGQVKNYAEKLHAETVAKRVNGVQALANELEVTIPAPQERGDREIAEAALNALKWHAIVPDENLKVVVHDAVVTLEGAVDWNYQKEAAYNAMKDLTGVRHVVNSIVITPTIKPAEVKESILAAIGRTTRTNAGDVQVSAIGSQIVLSGRVRSWIERETAESAAWSAPGVSEVTNNLQIVH